MTGLLVLLLLSQEPAITRMDGGYFIPDPLIPSIFNLKHDLTKCLIDKDYITKQASADAQLSQKKLVLLSGQVADGQKAQALLREELARVKNQKYQLDEPVFSRSNVISFSVGGVAVGVSVAAILWLAKR